MLSTVLTILLVVPGIVFGQQQIQGAKSSASSTITCPKISCHLHPKPKSKDCEVKTFFVYHGIQCEGCVEDACLIPQNTGVDHPCPQIQCHLHHKPEEHCVVETYFLKNKRRCTGCVEDICLGAHSVSESLIGKNEPEVGIGGPLPIHGNHPHDNPLNGPHDIPLNGPQDMPFNGPKDMPFNGPQDMPFNGPQDIPFNGPQDIPFNGPQDISFNGPQDMPFNGPQDIPFNGPQDIPFNGPQDIPFNGPQHIPLNHQNIPSNMPLNQRHDSVHGEPFSWRGNPQIINPILQHNTDNTGSLGLHQNLPQDNIGVGPVGGQFSLREHLQIARPNPHLSSNSDRIRENKYGSSRASRRRRINNNRRTNLFDSPSFRTRNSQLVQNLDSFDRQMTGMRSDLRRNDRRRLQLESMQTPRTVPMSLSNPAQEKKVGGAKGLKVIEEKPGTRGIKRYSGKAKSYLSSLFHPSFSR